MMKKLGISLKKRSGDLETVNQSLQDQKKIKMNPAVIYVLVICVMVGLSIFFVSDAMSSGAKAVAETFVSTKDATKDATYDRFYDTAFDYSEQKHHVSNDVSIEIGKIKEEQKLEVLKVYDVTYEVTEDDEVDMWLEVPAYGIFTVDLRKSEFIIDSYNQYVLVRVASPVLSQFTLDSENIKQLHFDEGLFDDAEDGIKVGEKLLKNAEINLKLGMLNNQDNYLRAEKSAQSILINMVRQLNPQLSELVVEVEFIQ